MRAEVTTFEYGGRWYVVLQDGCRQKFYEIKSSAKKFSAQMEKIAEQALPEAVRRFLGR